MAETYWPFDAGSGAVVDEGKWMSMARLWCQSGVVPKAADGAVGLNGAATIPYKSTIQAGEAFINGFYYKNDAALVLTHTNPAASTFRTDLVVARLDRTANTIALAIKAGTPAASAAAAAEPTVTQDTSGVFEIPILKTTWSAASTTAVSFADRRVLVASPAATLSRISAAEANIASHTSLIAALQNADDDLDDADAATNALLWKLVGPLSTQVNSDPAVVLTTPVKLSFVNIETVTAANGDVVITPGIGGLSLTRLLGVVPLNSFRTSPQAPYCVWIQRADRGSSPNINIQGQFYSDTTAGYVALASSQVRLSLIVIGQ